MGRPWVATSSNSSQWFHCWCWSYQRAIRRSARLWSWRDRREHWSDGMCWSKESSSQCINCATLWYKPCMKKIDTDLIHSYQIMKFIEIQFVWWAIFGSHLCGMYSEGIGVNSIRCTSCSKWVHRWCSSVKGRRQAAVFLPVEVAQMASFQVYIIPWIMCSSWT